MDIKITFQHMEHSDNIDAHVRQKLEKLHDFFKESDKPLRIEVWLKANKQHAHHHAEIHLRAPHFSIDAHDENPDMYMAIDRAVDKMTKQVVKEKEKMLDHQHRVDSEKNKFRS